MNDDVVQLLEAQRKRIFPYMIICILCLFGGVVGFFISRILPLIGGLIAILLYFLVVSPKTKEYAETYKMLVVEKPFSETFQNFRYQPKNGFPKEMIRGTSLIQMGNIYQSEDYMIGSYKNVRFERSDVLIQDRESDGNGNSHTVTYFQGRWLIFEFNKQFHEDLQIIQKGFMYTNTKKGFFTRKSERRHAVEFENERFNECYDCYCQNDQEAYYIVTPQFMEAIMHLRDLMDGKMMFGFINNRLHIAINCGKNTLEPSLMRPVTYQNDFLAVKQEINAITDLVSVLNLDRDIYKTV